MLEFAEFLTTNPSGVSEAWADGLRDVGWADEDIVDITALFNYMDRVADGLGVELDVGRNWEGLLDRLSSKDDTAPKVFGKIAAPRAYPHRPVPLAVGGNPVYMGLFD